MFTTSCGDESQSTATGSLSVLLTTEDVITNGLRPGDDPGQIQDGWSVTFDRYIVAIGDIDLRFTTNASQTKEEESTYMVDLTKVSEVGLPLWSFDSLKAGRWEFGYHTVLAEESTLQHESVMLADYERIIAERWTYYIEGVLANENGQSCPPAELAMPGDNPPNGQTSGGNDCYDLSELRFSFGAPAETRFGPCEIDGVPGVAITSDQTRTASVTIHGDHLFFNGFPEGDEGGVARLAQWLADCDLNLDGEVTQEELQAIDPSLLSEFDDRFQLGGSPITPLNSVYEYLRAQLKTQGHFQGEGECAVDGALHDHEEGDHEEGDHKEGQ